MQLKEPTNQSGDIFQSTSEDKELIITPDVIYVWRMGLSFDEIWKILVEDNSFYFYSDVGREFGRFTNVKNIAKACKAMTKYHYKVEMGNDSMKSGERVELSLESLASWEYEKCKDSTNSKEGLKNKGKKRQINQLEDVFQSVGGEKQKKLKITPNAVYIWQKEFLFKEYWRFEIDNNSLFFYDNRGMEAGRFVDVEDIEEAYKLIVKYNSKWDKIGSDSGDMKVSSNRDVYNTTNQNEPNKQKNPNMKTTQEEKRELVLENGWDPRWLIQEISSSDLRTAMWTQLWTVILIGICTWWLWLVVWPLIWIFKFITFNAKWFRKRIQKEMKKSMERDVQSALHSGEEWKILFQKKVERILELAVAREKAERKGKFYGSLLAIGAIALLGIIITIFTS